MTGRQGDMIGPGEGSSGLSAADTRILSHFIERLERGETVDLREESSRHPHLVRELERAHADWRFVQDGLRVDPDAAPSEVRIALLDELLERLSGGTGGSQRYRVIEEIGSGGMGVIHRVWDAVLRRHLAMKVIRDPGVAKGTPDRTRLPVEKLARFIEEAQISSQLAHPGVVPIHDLGLDEEGHIFFTMPIIAGNNLAEVLELLAANGDGWTLTRALNVLLRVCETMAFAHSRGVVHRDLKPSNIMVGPFGETYVMDWGCALLVDEADALIQSDRRRQLEAEPESPIMTATGFAMGSAPYMPPEQAAGRRDEIGAGADIYAVGAILYEMLVGHPPYLDDASLSSPADVLAALHRRAPTPVGRAAKGIPEELEAICQHAMERDPKRRYPSMEEMASDLRAFLENRVVSAHATGPVAEFRKWVARNRAFAAALLVALVVALGSAWLLVLQEKNNSAALTRERDKNDITQLAGLKRQAEDLYPIHPSKLDEMTAWLDQARDLVGRRDRHVAMLQELRAGPELDLATSSWIGRFEEFIHELDLFESEDPYGNGISGVERRVEWVRLLQLQQEDPDASWIGALDEIRDPEVCPKYNGLVIEPQNGLMPLARNEETGLWEFWHVLSGSPPQPDEFGEWIIGPQTAVVLVLIPGGRYSVGAQSDELLQPNYDPRFEPGTYGPAGAFAVDLEPFFVAKYEMTQAQWKRLTGANPSHYRSGRRFQRHDWTFSADHPVEGVTWHEARRVLDRIGLELPTEAQWEAACRGGTETRHWFGGEDDSLDGEVNLFDRTAATVFRPQPEQSMTTFVDEYPAHAPVHLFRPNPFGLFNVHGNVYEWCADPGIGLYRDGFRPGDGMLTPTDDTVRPIRGGSFMWSEKEAGSAYREATLADSRGPHIGLRACRKLDRP